MRKIQALLILVIDKGVNMDWIFIRSTLGIYLITFLIFYFSAKKSDSRIIKIPKILSYIFGSPVGKGKMPIYQFMGCLCNLVTLIISILLYYFYNGKLAINAYGYSLAISLVLTTVLQGFIQKDFWR